MHYLLAICLILSLTPAYPGSILHTPQEAATTAPDLSESVIHLADDEDEEDDEPDCD
ncbi:MAG: hypothetical protein AAFP10_06405 [Pseudomonadota bacterium]